ncbi:MAG: sulfur carrier protein ThiS [Phycisphaerales bacterium]|nr:sulfur carrier protein ThiS [Phycisphaerales bacterium]
MQLTVNGEKRELQAETIGTALVELGMDAAPCAVEVNRTLIPARTRDEHKLTNGDVLEIVTLVGGG